MNMIQKTENVLKFLKDFDIKDVISIESVSYFHITKVMVRNHSEVKRVLNIIQPGKNLEVCKDGNGYISKLQYCNIELFCVSEVI